MAETSLDAFKAKDTRFVADWLKSKGLHKLCSVFEGIQESFVISLACKARFRRRTFHVPNLMLLLSGGGGGGGQGGGSPGE